MRRYQIYALGQDAYWLKAMTKVADQAVTVQPIQCSASYLERLGCLPDANPEALLLIDATRQPNVEAVVQRLREQGWRYVVVVAADPSWEEARAVLQGSVDYDYWGKSYDPAIIQRSVKECLAQMGQEEGIALEGETE